MRCAVITPVGPGHESIFEECAASVSFAIEYSKGPFEEIEHIFFDDTKGQFGRSNARNQMIQQAKDKGFDWLFFLDSDDLIVEDVFSSVEPYIKNGYDAIWGVIVENKFGTELIKIRDNQKTPLTDIKEILVQDAYYTLQMGHFVKTQIASEFGFDPDMNSGEDFKYYMRLWSHYTCIKTDKIFFLNRRGNHSTGPRSADGAQWRENVSAILRSYAEKRDDLYVSFDHRDKEVFFAIDAPMDFIQACHCNGTFFEDNELKMLEFSVGKNKTILEVGANIGNHLVYYGTTMKPKVIIPIEPNPRCLRLLAKNIQMNNLEEIIDKRGLGKGAGKTSGKFRVNIRNENNLGASQIVEDENGDIDVVAIDDLIPDIDPDFIKIDVEGMEMDVLEGAKSVIARAKPIIFIEIANENISAFEKWILENKYKTQQIVKYVNAVNYLVEPIK